MNNGRYNQEQLNYITANFDAFRKVLLELYKSKEQYFASCVSSFGKKQRRWEFDILVTIIRNEIISGYGSLRNFSRKFIAGTEADVMKDAVFFFGNEPQESEVFKAIYQRSRITSLKYANERDRDEIVNNTRPFEDAIKQRYTGIDIWKGYMDNLSQIFTSVNCTYSLNDSNNEESEGKVVSKRQNGIAREFNRSLMSEQFRFNRLFFLTGFHLYRLLFEKNLALPMLQQTRGFIKGIEIDYTMHAKYESGDYHSPVTAAQINKYIQDMLTQINADPKIKEEYDGIVQMFDAERNNSQGNHEVRPQSIVQPQNLNENIIPIKEPIAKKLNKTERKNLISFAKEIGIIPTKEPRNNKLTQGNISIKPNQEGDSLLGKNNRTRFFDASPQVQQNKDEEIYVECNDPLLNDFFNNKPESEVQNENFFARHFTQFQFPPSKFSIKIEDIEDDNNTEQDAAQDRGRRLRKIPRVNYSENHK
jgi:hypothetical protein